MTKIIYNGEEIDLNEELMPGEEEFDFINNDIDLDNAIKPNSINGEANE